MTDREHLQEISLWLETATDIDRSLPLYLSLDQRMVLLRVVRRHLDNIPPYRGAPPAVPRIQR